MSLLMDLPIEVTEWGWLFGFALVSLALVALAVLADALYEGYRARVRSHRELATRSNSNDELGPKRKKAA